MFTRRRAQRKAASSTYTAPRRMRPNTNMQLAWLSMCLKMNTACAHISNGMLQALTSPVLHAYCMRSHLQRHSACAHNSRSALDR